MEEKPDENPAENSIGDIRKYLAKDAKPFKENEFADFWKSLTDDEKNELKQADLGE